MPDVTIKSPNVDDIFNKWLDKTVRKNKKKLEKQFGTKGAVFSTNNISAAETVQDTMKEAAIYFEIKRIIAPVKKKEEEEVVRADKVRKEDFYLFKKDVNKENWDDDDVVPMYDSIEPVPCKECKGKGVLESKCKNCKGTGTIEDKMKIYVGEEQDKEKKYFKYPCGDCHGTGKITEPCKECKGHKNFYKYKIKAVPFKSSESDIPYLFSSGKTTYEKQIGEDLHELIEEVEGIKFNDFKTLDKKVEPSLGYYNKKIKKTVSRAESQYKDFSKDDSVKITTPIYLFPLIQMSCETKKGKSFEIYSVGSDKRFITYSSF
ncbi:MAG: DnaJ domain protein [Promethearchaeota archaeon]|nr:MAG: DnaJ domain protein [Candidatus Lokiarchaeota archaeon]